MKTGCLALLEGPAGSLQRRGSRDAHGVQARCSANGSQLLGVPRRGPRTRDRGDHTGTVPAHVQATDGQEAVNPETPVSPAC